MGYLCHLFPAKKQLVYIHQRLHPLQVNRCWFKSSNWSLTLKREADPITGTQTPPGSHSTGSLQAKFVLYIITASNEAASLVLFRFTWDRLSSKFADKNKFVMAKLGVYFFFITNTANNYRKKPKGRKHTHTPLPTQHVRTYKILNLFAWLSFKISEYILPMDIGEVAQ